MRLTTYEHLSPDWATEISSKSTPSCPKPPLTPDREGRTKPDRKKNGESESKVLKIKLVWPIARAIS